MRRTLVFAVAAVVVLPVLLAGCGRDVPAVAGTETIAPGDRGDPLEISGTTLDGAPLGLADYRGRVVVLNDWASWCAPCRDEMPALARFAADNPDVAVVGLNVEDEAAAATAFLAETGADFPSIVDRDGSLLRQIPGVPPSALPSTVVLDVQGRVAARVIGPTDPQELADLVEGAAQPAG